MSLIKRKKFNYQLLEDEPPTDKLVSEGDLFIKRLAEKQQSTTASLNELLNKPKHFTKGFEVTPLSHYSSGTSSLSDVISATRHFNSVEYLKGAGLTNEEVELYLDGLNGFEYVCNKHKNWERNLLMRHLESLQAVVEGYKKSSELIYEDDLRNSVVQHGLTIKPDSIETKLLKFALHNSQERKSPISKSIYNIAEIEKNRFSGFNDQPLPAINRIRRKARKLQNRLNKTKQDSEKNCNGVEPQPNSKWDVKEEESLKLVLKTTEKKVYTCSSINYYTIRNNEIVKLNGDKERLEINSKLSLEEIKQLPKFKDYIPGNPSKVLYIKNLNNFKEEDLKILFNKYESSIEEYKIMQGRLRGQAFVKFSNEDKASEALHEINGTVIKKKPVIIHFSSKT